MGRIVSYYSGRDPLLRNTSGLPIRRPLATQKKSKKKRLVIFSLIPLALCFIIWQRHPRSATEQVTAANTSSATPTPLITPITEADIQVGEVTNQSVNNLSFTFQKIAQKYTPVDWKVAYLDVDTGESQGYQEDSPVFAASVNKIVTAAYVFSLIDAGTVSLDQSFGGYPMKFQLEQLVNQSNGDAWDQLNDTYGFNRQADFAHQKGITSYDPSNNSISPKDAVLLFKLLYQGQLISSASTKMLLSFMQETNEERFIPPSLGEDISIYHKTGLYESYAHDVAILKKDTHTVILGLFSNGNGIQNYDDRADQFKSFVKPVLGRL